MLLLSKTVLLSKTHLAVWELKSPGSDVNLLFLMKPLASVCTSGSSDSRVLSL